MDSFPGGYLFCSTCFFCDSFIPGGTEPHIFARPPRCAEAKRPHVFPTEKNGLESLLKCLRNKYPLRQKVTLTTFSV